MILYFINLFANITEDVEKLHYITPFSFSDASEIFTSEKILTEYLIPGMLIMMVFILIGYLRYSKKDLRI